MLHPEAAVELEVPIRMLRGEEAKASNETAPCRFSIESAAGSGVKTLNERGISPTCKEGDPSSEVSPHRRCEPDFRSRQLRQSISQTPEECTAEGNGMGTEVEIASEPFELLNGYIATLLMLPHKIACLLQFEFREYELHEELVDDKSQRLTFDPESLDVILVIGPDAQLRTEFCIQIQGSGDDKRKGARGEDKDGVIEILVDREGGWPVRRKPTEGSSEGLRRRY
ncbi:hypothetical protein BJ508DRAFT_335579 [Ascobolus immersus RN42]|uniref:Uncharacterized protein n=1 Tax=Ascobolus immersus RN42 TaxID=1160509 RepID=A0A3N4HGD1_ASCIM|nr:hypothetical protein BJ508DRAFT_335579 [Ascobolus immersus RN42]